MIRDFDSYSGDAGLRSWNGRPGRVAHHDKTPDRDPYEELAWAMLEQAVCDTTLLCRYGLIRSNGELKPWPRVPGTDHRGHQHSEWMRIGGLCDPMEHARLREFFADPMQGQLWCDLCGCRLPAKDIWTSVLQHHAK